MLKGGVMKEVKTAKQSSTRRTALKLGFSNSLAALLLGAGANSALGQPKKDMPTLEEIRRLRELNITIQKELVSDPKNREAFLKDPRGYLRKHGIDLPPDAIPPRKQLEELLAQ